MHFICLVALLVVQVAAQCPNGCGMHGTCGTGSACTCFAGFGGPDCSLREPARRGMCTLAAPRAGLFAVCACAAHFFVLRRPQTVRARARACAGLCGSGPAWVGKSALGAGNAHADAVCSNAGVCDYSTGLCSCRPGFEGIACETRA
jgi:hypothetical protein